MHSYNIIKAPIGEILLTAYNEHITAVHTNHNSNFTSIIRGKHNPELFMQVEQQLNEYFIGKRKIFDLPLAPKGTIFQKKVWEFLQKIPYGSIITYAQLAAKIDNPKAVRAVGTANGKNAFQIIIPCHRVITTTREYGGYNGGAELKAKLIALEKENR